MASVIAVSCPIGFHLDLSHASLPHLEGSFAVAKSGNGGNAGGNGAGNNGGGGNGRGGGDRGSDGNHGGGNSHGNGAGASRAGHDPSEHNAGSSGKNTTSGARDVSPKSTGPAQARAIDRGRVLHGPAQGQRLTPSAKARDMRVKPQRAKYTLVASGLTDTDLAKLMARGFRVQAQTKGSLSPRTIRLQLPSGLSLDQARRAVRRINAKAVVDFDSYYYTDGETPEDSASVPKFMIVVPSGRRGASRNWHRGRPR
jgi:hypothetical protein